MAEKDYKKGDKKESKRIAINKDERKRAKKSQN